MRTTFVKTLFEEAKKNRNIVFITGDLGFSVIEEYVETLPDQFINAGVAEQNMTGIAAGLAMEGKLPVIYSIVPFVTMRNFEQIRNDICYQGLNVKVVGSGSGFSYGPYGHTHHGLEDIAIMRSLADMTIFSPSDPTEAEFVTKIMLRRTGPTYLRLGKAGEPKIYDTKPNLKFAKGSVVLDGKDVAIFSTGAITANSIRAAEILKNDGYSVKLVSIHTIKPIDSDLIKKTAKDVKALISVEEHSVIGGLGSAISEILAENGISVPFVRVGVHDRFTKEIGLQDFMREKNNLSPQLIAQAMVKLIQRKN